MPLFGGVSRETNMSQQQLCKIPRILQDLAATYFVDRLLCCTTCSAVVVVVGRLWACHHAVPSLHLHRSHTCFSTGTQ
jgi:hypothetical protein